MAADNELDALIVEHIADLEEAHRRIENVIDPRLLDEASSVLKKKADANGWVHELDRNNVISVAPEKWIERGANGGIEHWFSWFALLSEDTADDLEHDSHLADFLALEGGSTRKVLAFKQNPLAKRKWRALLESQTEALEDLRIVGFEVDEREGTIEWPVRLDPAKLQQGFREDDLDAALAPVEVAIDKAIEALPPFRSACGGGACPSRAMRFLQSCRTRSRQFLYSPRLLQVRPSHPRPDLQPARTRADCRSPQ
jgi:hypothetical protein